MLFFWIFCSSKNTVKLHIRLISEESCDTEGIMWQNSMWSQAPLGRCNFVAFVPYQTLNMNIITVFSFFICRDLFLCHLNFIRQYYHKESISRHSVTFTVWKNLHAYLRYWCLILLYTVPRNINKIFRQNITSCIY